MAYKLFINSAVLVGCQAELVEADLISLLQFTFDRLRLTVCSIIVNQTDPILTFHYSLSTIHFLFIFAKIFTT